jgi:hypothetical protein
MLVKNKLFVTGTFWGVYDHDEPVFYCTLALDTHRFEDECGTETLAFPNPTDHRQGLDGPTVGGQVVHLVRFYSVAIHVPGLLIFRMGLAIVGKGNLVECAVGARFTKNRVPIALSNRIRRRFLHRQGCRFSGLDIL